MTNQRLRNFLKKMKSAAIITALSLTLSACEFGYTDILRKDADISHTSSVETDATYGFDSVKDFYTDIDNAVDENSAESFKEIPEGRGTFLSLTDENELEISRISLNEKLNVDEEIWTVFVYMCGSDLESSDGIASYDLEEMRDATGQCPNLRFVVEADGTENWQNDICEDGKKQRLLITDGEYETVYSGESTNMGDADTLVDFLDWGLAEYGSRFNVLDFWNHGGGSISGVCFDETHDMNSLTLREIDNALSLISESLTCPFEIIGCDACLMATVELANILAAYGKYMIGSQEIESGYGWDYTLFADAVNNGAKNGGEVGKYICQGYYESCVRSDEDKTATLSVIDLSKLDEFLVAFNRHCKDVYSYICDENGLTDVIKAAESAINFGGNNRSEGYTNMVDLYSFINNTSDFSYHGKNASELFNDCIYYVRNGKKILKAGGLDIYYPLCVQGSTELNELSNISVSPYYISIVDICAFGRSANGSIDGYDINNWLGDDTKFWSDSELDYSKYGYWDNNSDNSLNTSTDRTALSFVCEPSLDENGIYTFTLTEESLSNLDTVYNNIMLSYPVPDSDKEYMLDLGTDNCVDMDYDTGKCMDLFDGMWFILPDGQPICTFLIESSFENDVLHNVYTSPIYLNGKYTNLRITLDYFNEDETEIITVSGVWDGIDENGSASKTIYKLKDGDVIEPCYYAYDAETLEYAFELCGDAYVCGDELAIDYDYLCDGDYYYAFEIYDYYGNVVYTDFVMFGTEIDEEGNVEVFYYY